MTCSGNLTKDAVSREVSTANGTIYAVQFTIAMNEKYGETEKACYLPCTYWAKSDKIVPHLTKGKAIIAQIDWYSNTESEGRWFQDFRVRKIDFQRGENSTNRPIQSPPPAAQVSTAPTEIKSTKEEKTFNPFAEEEDDDLPF